MRTQLPSADDILYGFAVEWDETPSDLTMWKQRYPLWATDIEQIATEIIRDRQQALECLRDAAFYD